MASDAYRLAGAVVRVEWEDEGLRAALGQALAHRRVVAAEPALVIRARSGATFPSVGPQGGLIATEGAGGLSVIEPVSRVSHRLEGDGANAEFTCASAGELPMHERAAPFRLILQAWLRRRGVQMLHAGAVGLPGRGAVLLAARSGGGKSNTTLACLESGLQLLGEDYVAVDEAESPRVWSLYGSAKLLPADLGRFPGLAARSAGADPRDDKVLLPLADLAGRWVDGLPLKGILVLQITGGAETRIVPASPAEAVKAMVTSLLMVLPSVRRPLFEFTTRLAARVPVYRLELGRDTRQLAATIHDFLLREQS